MSLRWYVKKGKPALWTTVAGARLVRSAKDAAKEVVRKHWRSKPFIATSHDHVTRTQYLSLVSKETPTEKRARELAWMSKGVRRFKSQAPKPSVAARRKSTALQNRLYAARAKEFVRAAVARGETCPVVAAVPELRDGFRYGWPVSARLTEAHHTRGRIGSLLMDERFWMPLSKAGHRWVHAHPEEARKRGWLCEKGSWNRSTP